MTTEHHRIDVHYHIIPKPYVDALARRGITGAAWVKFPKWAPSTAIRQLDRMEIATAVTSLSTPGVWFGDPALARDLARLCNEFQARMMSDYLGGFVAREFKRRGYFVKALARSADKLTRPPPRISTRLKDHPPTSTLDSERGLDDDPLLLAWPDGTGSRLFSWRWSHT